MCMWTGNKRGLIDTGAMSKLAGIMTMPLRLYAVIVDKSRQQIRLCRRGKRWRTIAKWPCSTRKQAGSKFTEGDQKTPVGVYFAVEEDRVAIIAETFQTAPDTAVDPLFSAWQKLWKKGEQRSRMAVTQNSGADL